VERRILNVKLTPPSPEKIEGLHKQLDLRIASPALSVDLRSKCPAIYDQGYLGSCTGFASAKGLREILDLIEGRPHTEFSALFAYWNERSAEKTIDQDAGAQIVDAVAVLLHEGACPETLDPYEIGAFRTAPSREAFEAAKAHKVTDATHLRSVSTLIDCLAKGYPVIGGIPVYDGDNGLESSQALVSGNVGMPNPGDNIAGGHAVVLVGYDLRSRTFLVRNSWGSNWGDRGYFRLPFDYVEQLANPATGDWWTVRIY
jgi:C1A family cysteine protease